ncbi:hypothetical protein [Microcoleus sp. B9-D4]|uniref:hypothetical protein n=1 Tax=Microcoleus sp. B9-D4 TaxID=2818711 RepID=UPI002FD32BF9
MTQKLEDTIAHTTAFSSRGIGCRIDPAACKKVRTPVCSIRPGDRLRGNCTGDVRSPESGQTIDNQRDRTK